MPWSPPNSKLDPEDDLAVSNPLEPVEDVVVPLDEEECAEGLESRGGGGGWLLVICLGLFTKILAWSGGGWSTGGCWICRAQFSLWLEGFVGL